MAAYRQVYGLKSPVGWLPVHLDQLRAQRSVTSTEELSLFTIQSPPTSIYMDEMRQLARSCAVVTPAGKYDWMTWQRWLASSLARLCEIYPRRENVHWRQWKISVFVLSLKVSEDSPKTHTRCDNERHERHNVYNDFPELPFRRFEFIIFIHQYIKYTGSNETKTEKNNVN